MWGFRMDSWGLVKSSRAIYKDHHHALSAMGRYGFKQHQLPFLVDIQAQIVSLSKSLSFGYILTHHPRDLRRNRTIPTPIFSSSIFESGWDGKTVPIALKKRVQRMKIQKVKEADESKSAEDEKDEKQQEKEEPKEKEKKSPKWKRKRKNYKVPEISTEDMAKNIVRRMYIHKNL